MTGHHALRMFDPATQDWFLGAFPGPTPPQVRGWESIARAESTLIFAPTGSGKTLAAFLWCIDRAMFGTRTARPTCRVVYVSPLKALAVDVERNLRSPLAGIAEAAARRGVVPHVPTVMVRTGDTPSQERARFAREPAEILVTTPESLYLLLTSNARSALRGVETVIIDEIHALVPTKRGAHLALSLERLEHLTGRRLQRIGLSATQRPLDEVARFLGGAQPEPHAPSATPSSRRSSSRGRERQARVTPLSRATEELHREFDASRGPAAHPRPVTIVDARARKALDLRIEVPVDDMAAPDVVDDVPSGPAAQGPRLKSMWPAIHPRLLALVREHTSTLMFVNGRRTAERLAASLNELAGESLVRAHHGSVARAQRLEIEDQLKNGRLRGLVATSSLELGIDMGAIDLVVQIEAPPSVASGLQRVGRGGHHVDATSRAVIFPKFRGDLVACAAVTRAMRDGHVEATRYPRNPLDVLAQQLVAMVAMDPWSAHDLFDAVRGAAPYAQLARSTFDGVLDMLSGRYPSDDFAELRPRLTWDRTTGLLSAREGARRIAVINGGTIPDRGLYGVFLAGAPAGAARVGELDEEMVFESKVGETFVLGASTWRIDDITHDRVVVSPAPGEPGKMPFWKGDSSGRPLEFGRAIGALARTISHMPKAAAVARLRAHHDVNARAAENLVAYLEAQRGATGAVPDDKTVVVERYRDDFGDWRVCVLTPFGGQVLAPWAIAAAARVRDTSGVEVETMWTDDGFVVRFPETDDPPDVTLLLPDPDEVEALVVRHLGATALFAAKFRECAGRALLLPKRRPGGRAPLWQQRRRASDLLAVAAEFGSFPIVLEAYRECLRDVFDLPALVDTLRGIADERVRVVCVDRTAPSPFASALLFGYVANFMYEGDAPLAERRAQALAIDHTQLRELLGDVGLRDLLDLDAVLETARELQALQVAPTARSADGLHDMLLRLGDLSPAEAAARLVPGAGVGCCDTLLRSRRAVLVSIGSERRLIAVEDAARYRDALGVSLPPGLPEALLAPSPRPWRELVRRFARTHAPFTADDVAKRYGVGRAVVESTLQALAVDGRVLEGEFTPGVSGREWCDPRVLATIRRRSLAKVRRSVEPVEPHVLGRLVTTWQGVVRPRTGLDALLDAIESLQGAPLPASIVEREILPARVDAFAPADLDALLAAGEVVWTGAGALGERDGRIRLFLADQARRLMRPAAPASTRRAKAAEVTVATSDRELAILDYVTRVGASFFDAIHEAIGGGFTKDTLDALWALVWRGAMTNDTFQPVRSRVGPSPRTRALHAAGRVFRSRRLTPPEAAGRWSLVETRVGVPSSATEWSASTAQTLLRRYGLVTREVAQAEAIPGGFSAVYDVLRTMEEHGKIQRGYFVTGVGAAQFASPSALDLLRTLRTPADVAEVVCLAATDPANPYGTLLPWPTRLSDDAVGRGPTRVVGGTAVLVDGALAGYVAKSRRQLLVYLPDDEPERGRVAHALADAVWGLAGAAERVEKGLLISEIDGAPALEHAFGAHLQRAGFQRSAMGYQRLRSKATAAVP